MSQRHTLCTTVANTLSPVVNPPCHSTSQSHSLARPGHQPPNYRIQIYFGLRTHPITAHLPARDTLQPQYLDQLIHPHPSPNITLIPQHQQRDPRQSLTPQQRLQLLSRNGQRLAIRAVDNEDNAGGSDTVPLPHRAVLGLAADVPCFEGYVAALDAFEVEADGRQGVGGEFPACEDAGKRGFAGVLEAEDGYVEFG